ncbi:MAG TPA: ATP-binding cassette domain-containing protein [Propionibacteriaceae bacterium]|nr:ATP-binding cassette domain-containing protein [Propionibacteriaceae bacterium]
MSDAAEVAGGAPGDHLASPDHLAISSVGLTKSFGSQLVVDAIDLAVPRGSVYGFIGPNGSGKTTTIRMLLGLISTDGGSCSLLGHAMPRAADDVLPNVGMLVEGPAFHPYLSGRANLLRLDAADRYAEARTARARVDAALDRVGLLAAARKRYRAYSLGMRQRLAIAAALLQPRELLILDEPTNGLDPQGTREVRHLIGELASDGHTVFVSSHLLSEVEQMCSHLGVMLTGRLVAQGRVADIGRITAPRVHLHTPDAVTAAETLTRIGVTEVVDTPEGLVGTAGDVEPERIVAELVASGVRVRSFAEVKPTLEDLFVQLTGEGFDVSG